MLVSLHIQFFKYS